MNFFEHQDQARQQSRWLVALFILAVLSIAGVIGALAYFLAGWALVPYASGSVLLIILLASCFKTLGLRQGGGQVARAMQGTLVDPNTSDPVRRRLHRVVEEMAIASGVPVPEVYVLEHESGINAFAAGYTPNDAAVAVTRGLLERLDRAELQGVVAHEFSHILNGDMRINIRLMGVLFGVLVIALMGQHLMQSARFSRNSKDTAPLVILSLIVVMVGYIGLFFGRLIKAAVSRQREYLADAAAVQFTRDPSGIAGALKKIALLSEGSHLQTDGEEISHMLFGQGRASFWMATHPPLIKRIQALEPDFTESDLALWAKKPIESVEAMQPEPAAGLSGQDWPSWLAASVLLSELPEALQQRAHQDERIDAFLIGLLACDHWASRPHLATLTRDHLGEIVAESVNDMIQQWGSITKAWRLPLLEMAIPTLRRRPLAELQALQSFIRILIADDGVVDVHEYAIERLLDQAIAAIREPTKAQVVGSRSLDDCQKEVAQLLAITAQQGHGALSDQQAAWTRAMQALWQDVGQWPQWPEPWHEVVDRAVETLNELNAKGKVKVVDALVQVIAWDGQISDAEYALCRAVAALLQVPLPLTSD